MNNIQGIAYCILSAGRINVALSVNSEWWKNHAKHLTISYEYKQGFFKN